MAVTMNDVARAAGVSLKTVSNVLNDYEFIRPATKQRVQDAIAELGYEANLTARSLRSGKTSMLVILISSVDNRGSPVGAAAPPLLLLPPPPPPRPYPDPEVEIAPVRNFIHIVFSGM